MTNDIHPGWELNAEIVGIHKNSIGESIFIFSDSKKDEVEAVAIIQHGSKSEAGSQECYLKLGVAKDEIGIQKLLSATEHFTKEKKAKKLEFGVNLSRHKTFSAVTKLGYATEYIGVFMHTNNDPAHCRDDTFILDDYR